MSTTRYSWRDEEQSIPLELRLTRSQVRGILLNPFIRFVERVFQRQPQMFNYRDRSGGAQSIFRWDQSPS